MESGWKVGWNVEVLDGMRWRERLQAKGSVQFSEELGVGLKATKTWTDAAAGGRKIDSPM